MIYDCVIFNGEKDLLEIRVNELLQLGAITFVLVEANKTHTGEPKEPTFLHKFDTLFSSLYFIVDDMPEIATAKERERFQRNKISDALNMLQPADDDIIIISDVDEIPKASQIAKFVPEMEFAALIQNKYNYYVNLLEREQSWDRARICTYRYLKSRLPDEIRDSGYDFSLHHAGWHFSWTGGADAAVKKLQSFAHTELDTPENVEKVRQAKNIWDATEFTKVPVDLSFPRHLYDNQEKFKHLILE